MDNHTACEESYKRGYAAGLASYGQKLTKALKERDEARASKWISVKEQEPPVRSSIMIYSRTGGRAEGEYLGNGDFLQYRWEARVEATHWMPLSSIPEPEEEKE